MTGLASKTEKILVEVGTTATLNTTMGSPAFRKR
jgi:hypothetical protein